MDVFLAVMFISVISGLMGYIIGYNLAYQEGRKWGRITCIDDEECFNRKHKGD